MNLTLPKSSLGLLFLLGLLSMLSNAGCSDSSGESKVSLRPNGVWYAALGDSTYDFPRFYCFGFHRDSLDRHRLEFYDLDFITHTFDASINETGIASKLLLRQGSFRDTLSFSIAHDSLTIVMDGLRLLFIQNESYAGYMSKRPCWEINLPVVEKSEQLPADLNQQDVRVHRLHIRKQEEVLVEGVLVPIEDIASRLRRGKGRHNRRHELLLFVDQEAPTEYLRMALQAAKSEGFETAWLMCEGEGLYNRTGVSLDLASVLPMAQDLDWKETLPGL